MSREEAIKNIKEHCYFANLIPPAKEALDMAIKALEQEQCEDAISREETLKELMDEWTEFDSELMDYLIEKVKKLPPVSPRPKMGKWIYNKKEDSYRCSLCTFPCHKDNLGAIPTNYCANCGSYNGGDENADSD